MTNRDFETYVFDLDGTLLDTLRDLMASTNYALKSLDFRPRTLEEIRLFVGNGARVLIERAVPEGCSKEQKEAVYQAFLVHYREHNLDTTKPYDGILDMLHRLKEKGKHIAVVSNKPDFATKALCKHFFLGLVDVAMGQSDTIRRKPYSDMVNAALLAMGRSGVAGCKPCGDKVNAVYIGDSDVDIQTAKNAGLPCISVLWGFRSKAFLLENGAADFAASPSEIGA